ASARPSASTLQGVPRCSAGRATLLGVDSPSSRRGSGGLRWLRFQRRCRLQRQSLKLILAVLGLLAACLCLNGARAQGDPAKPLPENLIKEWKKAGAAVGGMFVNQNGRVEFKPEKDGKFPGIPAFQFMEWQDGLFAGLPAPERSFGLSFLYVQGRDLDLK